MQPDARLVNKRCSEASQRTEKQCKEPTSLSIRAAGLHIADKTNLVTAHTGSLLSYIIKSSMLLPIRLFMYSFLHILHKLKCQTCCFDWMSIKMLVKFRIEVTSFCHIRMSVVPVQPQELHIPLLDICRNLLICHVQVYSKHSCEQSYGITKITTLQQEEIVSQCMSWSVPLQSNLHATVCIQYKPALFLDICAKQPQIHAEHL